jgi:hypothetical protein
LQLPPVVADMSMPGIYRLITRLPYWPSAQQHSDFRGRTSSDTFSEAAQKLGWAKAGNARDWSYSIWWPWNLEPKFLIPSEFRSVGNLESLLVHMSSLYDRTQSLADASLSLRLGKPKRKKLRDKKSRMNCLSESEKMKIEYPGIVSESGWSFINQTCYLHICNVHWIISEVTHRNLW